MVTRAYGTANGQTVILTQTDGDKWETTVPFDQDGEYVVEMCAEDDAGNTSYLCTMLFVISGHELQCYIVPRGYAAEKEQAGYTGESAKAEYTSEIEGRGYTIERTVCSRDAG